MRERPPGPRATLGASVTRHPSDPLLPFRLTIYRTILTIGVLVMTPVGLLNLLVSDLQNNVASAASSLVTAGLVAFALLRTRQRPDAVLRDGPWVAGATFAIYVVAMLMNGTMSTPFVIAGLVLSFLVVERRPARMLSLLYLGATLVLVTLDGGDPVTWRIVAVALGVAATLDVVSGGLERLTVQLSTDNVTLRTENERLDSRVQDRTEALVKSQEALMVAMASLVEWHNAELAEHTTRVGRQMAILASCYAQQEMRDLRVDASWVANVVRAAPLHDIGKIGIASSILEKRGALTPEEYAGMQAHTTIGRNVIDQVIERVGSAEPFLVVARELIHGHHERWDGTGYPQGLAREDIPLAARLMAVIDVYDALVHARAYKPALPHETASLMIQEGAGTQFDPAVVAAFLACERELAATIDSPVLT